MTGQQLSFLDMQSGHTTDALTRGQLGALNSLINEFAQSKAARLWIISRLTGREITTSKEVTLDEWHVIRDAAYPDWREVSGDWPEVHPDYARKLAALSQQFEEEVNGQLRMFKDDV